MSRGGVPRGGAVVLDVTQLGTLLTRTFSIGPHDHAGSARAARTASANRESGRCAACKARGITLWRFSGHLKCGNCRGEMWAEHHRSSRQAPAAHSSRVLAQVSAPDLRVRLPLATTAWRDYGTFSASSTPGGDQGRLAVITSVTAPPGNACAADRTVARKGRRKGRSAGRSDAWR